MTVSTVTLFRVAVDTLTPAHSEYAVQAPDGLTAIQTVFNNGLIPSNVTNITATQFATNLVS